MIHEIVEDAYKRMDAYVIARDIEKHEMMYCLGRLDSAYGIERAMDILDNHLLSHYERKKDVKPVEFCYIGIQ